MKVFRQYVNENSSMNENYKVGNVKIPIWAKDFVEELKSAVMDQGMIVAEVIGLFANSPIGNEDFLESLRDQLKVRNIKL